MTDLVPAKSRFYCTMYRLTSLSLVKNKEAQVCFFCWCVWKTRAGVAVVFSSSSLSLWLEGESSSSFWHQKKGKRKASPGVMISSTVKLPFLTRRRRRKNCWICCLKTYFVTNVESSTKSNAKKKNKLAIVQGRLYLARVSCTYLEDKNQFFS